MLYLKKKRGIQRQKMYKECLEKCNFCISNGNLKNKFGTLTAFFKFNGNGLRSH